jgi:hypothetical protein
MLVLFVVLDFLLPDFLGFIVRSCFAELALGGLGDDALWRFFSLDLVIQLLLGQLVFHNLELIVVTNRP